MTSSTPATGATVSPSSRPPFFRSWSSTPSLSMSLSRGGNKKHKPRLYLVLYRRGGASPSSSSYSSGVTCDSYHWALLVGSDSASRTQQGTCYQVLHSNGKSYYEETDLSQHSPSQAMRLLCRITLCKVRDEEQLRLIFRSLGRKNDNDIDRDSRLYLSSAESLSSCGSRGSDDSWASADAGSPSSCLHWIRSAYQTLTTHPSMHKMLRGYITCDDWEEIEQCARRYVKKKRNMGRYSDDIAAAYRHWDDEEVATFNYWENRETTP